MNLFSADFEATVNEEGVEVYWAGLESLATGKQQNWTTHWRRGKKHEALVSFMNTVFRLKDGSTVAMHNLSGYDHGFIYDYIAVRLGRPDMIKGDTSDFTVHLDNGKRIRFFDSRNWFTSSLEALGKSVDMLKGAGYIKTPLIQDFDEHSTTIVVNEDRYGQADREYETIPRPIKLVMQEREWDKYAELDVAILAKVLKHYQCDLLLQCRINSAASWAMQDAFLRKEHGENWLQLLAEGKINKYQLKAPTIVDSHVMKLKPSEFLPKYNNTFMRLSYKGGLTWVHTKWRNQLLKTKGNTYDINSMYPWIYSQMILPTSYPIAVTRDTGEMKRIIDGENPFFVRFTNLSCVAKDDTTMPFLKNRTDETGHNAKFYDRVFRSNDVTLITGVEYKLLMETYTDIKYDDMLVFEHAIDHELMDVCKQHVAYWYPIKQTAERDSAEMFIAKLMINSFYGKLGEQEKWVPIHDLTLDENILNMQIRRTDDDYPVMVPIGNTEANVAAASYITAYGRCYLAEIINKLGNRFIYCDTDSIHAIGDCSDVIPVGEALGQFKVEFEWFEGKWLAPKTYAEYGHKPNNQDNYWVSHIAGFSYPINIKDFKLGTTLKTTKRKYTKGGIVIANTVHTIGGK